MKLTAKETLDIIKLLSVSETLEDFITKLEDYVGIANLTEETEIKEDKEEIKEEKTIPPVEIEEGKASIYSKEYASLAQNEVRKEKEILKIEIPEEEETVTSEVKSTAPNLGKPKEEPEPEEEEKEESYGYLTPEEIAPFGGTTVNPINENPQVIKVEEIKNDIEESINIENKPKTKVLTPQIKNQWEGARTVSPGELNL